MKSKEDILIFFKCKLISLVYFTLNNFYQMSCFEFFVAVNINSDQFHVGKLKMFIWGCEISEIISQLISEGILDN